MYSFSLVVMGTLLRTPSCHFFLQGVVNRNRPRRNLKESGELCNTAVVSFWHVAGYKLSNVVKLFHGDKSQMRYSRENI